MTCEICNEFKDEEDIYVTDEIPKVGRRICKDCMYRQDKRHIASYIEELWRKIEKYKGGLIDEIIHG